MIRQAVIIGCLAAAGAAEAREQHMAQIAPSQYADSESMTNRTWNLNLPSLKQWSTSIELVGTSSNNLEFAIGHDANRDGRLSFDERGWWIAWDCGEWILGGMRDEVWGMSEAVSEEGWRFVTGGPDTNGVVWAHVEVDVRRHKSNPPWMYSETWDLVEVTRRGVDDPQEQIVFGTKTSGTLLILR